MARKGCIWVTELTVVGMQFRWKVEGRKTLARHVPFPVRFEREPDNPKDENAVKVNIAGDFKLTKLADRQLGYLRANIAAKLAPHFDSGKTGVVKAWVTEIDVDAGEATLDVRFRDKPSGRKTTGKKRKKKTS